MNRKAEYIERGRLIEALATAAKGGGYPSNIAEYVYQVCTDLPAADAAPVIHASWKIIRFDKADIFDYSFRCSNCGQETPRKAYPISPDFCPNCGAKMDGGEHG